jgi:hypothetical protein
VALDASIRSQKDVRAWLDGMRIEDVPMLDQEQLAACAASYGRPAVRYLARYFQKNSGFHIAYGRGAQLPRVGHLKFARLVDAA